MTPLDRAWRGIRWPSATLEQEWQMAKSAAYGSTEPWVGQLLGDLAVSLGAKRILECGTSIGRTAEWLMAALQRMGGGCYCGIEKQTALATQCRQRAARYPDVTVEVLEGDLPGILDTLDPEFDLVWVDDCHAQAHLQAELTALQRLLAPTGVIAGHDIAQREVRAAFAAIHGFALYTVPLVTDWFGIGLWQRAPS